MDRALLVINVLVPFLHGGDARPHVKDKRFSNDQMGIRFLSRGLLPSWQYTEALL
jgi:hypothetical protein